MVDPKALAEDLEYWLRDPEFKDSPQYPGGWSDRQKQIRAAVAVLRASPPIPTPEEERAPFVGPFTRKGNSIIRGGGQQMAIVRSAAEGDWLCNRLNTPPLPSVSGEREADGGAAQKVADAIRYADGYVLTPFAVGLIEAGIAKARTLSIGDRDRGYAEGLEAAIAAVMRVGNFGDYKREVLTGDYGQPRFDMMHQCLDAIRTLSPNKES